MMSSADFPGEFAVTIQIANLKFETGAPCGFSRLSANIVSLRLQRNFG